MRHKFLAILIIILLVPISLPFSNGSSVTLTKPLMAYRARVVPTIDGMISPSEWDDTVPYFIQINNTSITEGPLYVIVSAKHDEKNLYLLFLINDNESVSEDSLVIFNSTNSGFMIYADGNAYIARVTRSGIIGESPIARKSNCSYVNGLYIFEIALNISVDFPYIANDTIETNIGYIDYDPTQEFLWNAQRNTFSIGKWKEIEPEIYLSDNYYQGQCDICELAMLTYAYLMPTPTNLTATFSNKNIKLSWNLTNDGFIEKYKIFLSKEPNFPSNNTTSIEVLNENITSYEIANLSNGKYYFKVRAYGSPCIYTESNTVEVTINLQSPSSPTNLTAILSDSKVKLTWNPPVKDGNATITEYRIYRGTSPDSLQLIASVNSSTLEYLDSNVSKGKTYYYGVSAVNPIGESNLSDAVSIEIPEEKPQSTPSLGVMWIIGAIAFIMVTKHKKENEK